MVLSLSAVLVERAAIEVDCVLLVRGPPRVARLLAAVGALPECLELPVVFERL